MENNVILAGIRWRKSSYSGDEGGNCIECAPLGALAWRKSSYSGDQGGNCVEIAEAPSAAIAVRDSKTPTGPVLAFEPATFTAFVSWAGATAAE
ncbi:DUF397 domain-containing protein [Streptomyces sp. PSKA30]|uniref:DUF397 domain-containing protein n=1 Tax=Streptomyces sp. PSKA30 TaxID=2874597 RepID=UPI001CD15BE5|nr:DUF397 domain-containing protein [Streptomyces sp. PSKA30]MBZ9640047.1 DUF397 domain-containing protein [Streptomyces sp. PSKA30]